MDRNRLNMAVSYARRGWSVIPIPFRSKNPERAGWHQLRLSADDLKHSFGDRPHNIGVLLGEPSGWLIDVDLDHELAVTLAPDFLPATGSIFGRPGKPRSHWLYHAAHSIATRQWRLPDRKMVVELRSTGGQTLFPGSTHPNGEVVKWDRNDEPAIVDPPSLCAQLAALHEEVCRRLSIEPTKAPAAVRSLIIAPNSVLRRARNYLTKLPPAVSGQGGHDATFRAACLLAIGFGLDREQSLALLQEWNERCQPPWSDHELEHKVDDALRAPGWRGYLLSNSERTINAPVNRAIERANRHAVAHRRRATRRVRS